jgi:hypothetical protein
VADFVRDDIDCWWERDGLIDGPPKGDIPLFGSELVRDIPITKYIVVVEGGENALRLRAGKIPALAVLDADNVPTSRTLQPVARGAKFCLWPTNSKHSVETMKMLARHLYTAGAVEVRVLRYEPTVEAAVWPVGFAPVDAVEDPAMARMIFAMLFEDWSVKVRRPNQPKEQAESVEA